MLEYSSILRFTEEKDRTINSLVMRIHQRHIYGEKFLPMYTSKYVGTTNDLERYSYFSQIMQAHALSTAINSLRGARPFCMGSLYWQLNDVWPVSSWATVDYYGMYKAAHYTVRDLYWPLQAVVRHNSTNKTYTICAINDNIGF
jgi:beta-mannosidase